MPATALQLALPVPLPTLFDYAPPPGHVSGPGDVGRRLRVPFGARELVGIVAAVAVTASDPDQALREATGFLDDQPGVHHCHAVCQSGDDAQVVRDPDH